MRIYYTIIEHKDKFQIQNIINELEIPKDEEEYKYGKNDLFALIIIFKQMLRDEEFVDLINELSYEIDVLDGKVDTVPLNTILK